MIEYNFSQFIGIYKMVMDFCQINHISDDDVLNLRVRVHEPLQNGNCSVSIGLPSVCK